MDAASASAESLATAYTHAAGALDVAWTAAASGDAAAAAAAVARA